VGGVVEPDIELFVERSDFSLKNERHFVLSSARLELFRLCDAERRRVRAHLVHHRLEGATQRVIDVRLGDVRDDHVEQRLARVVVVVLGRVVGLLLVLKLVLAECLHLVQHLDVVDLLAEDDRAHLRGRVVDLRHSLIALVAPDHPIQRLYISLQSPKLLFVDTLLLFVRLALDLRRLLRVALNLLRLFLVLISHVWVMRHSAIWVNGRVYVMLRTRNVLILYSLNVSLTLCRKVTNWLYI
jgi:hypothetical protein